MGHDLATLTSTTNEYVGVSFNLGCKRLLYSEWPSLNTDSSTETQEAVVLAESQMALTAACAVSGEEGMSSERSAPWALSWAKTGGGGERTGVADTRPSNPRLQ